MIKICFLVFLLFPAISLAQPSIAFDEEIHDFGTLQNGVVLEHEFVFVNNGDAELVIEKLVPS
jgi:hypothetical protein